MDFSALNPRSINALSYAAGKNDVLAVRALLEAGKSPNANDNRGWTALHVAAANDAYETLQMLLECPVTNPLAETFEGHTALYLSCRNKCSLKTVKLLLKYGECIAEYASNEMVSPLHVVCGQGRMEVVEALIQAGSIINLQDYDGDSSLHEAARGGHPELCRILLHSGADASLKNSYGLTPFLLSCFKGSLECVTVMYDFILDINEAAWDGNTALILAAQRGALDVAKFLLERNADPNIQNKEGALPLYTALTHGNPKIFSLLLPVTDIKKINTNLMNFACKPLYFSMDIIVTLLESNLGPEFFNKCDRFHVILEKIFHFRPRYSINPPFCSLLNVIEYIYKSSPELSSKLTYLLLTKGVAVNALYEEECPPLVFLHYCEHAHSHAQVIDILISQGCNVDYSTMPKDREIVVPDAIIASVTSGGHTLPKLLSYSLQVEPEEIILRLIQYNMIGQRVSAEIISKILPMCCLSHKVSKALEDQLKPFLRSDDIEFTSDVLDMVKFRVPGLKHLCRRAIRGRLKRNASSTVDFLNILKILPLPVTLKSYLRFC